MFLTELVHFPPTEINKRYHNQKMRAFLACLRNIIWRSAVAYSKGVRCPDGAGVPLDQVLLATHRQPPDRPPKPGPTLMQKAKPFSSKARGTDPLPHPKLAPVIMGDSVVPCECAERTSSDRRFRTTTRSDYFQPDPFRPDSPPISQQSTLQRRPVARWQRDSIPPKDNFGPVSIARTSTLGSCSRNRELSQFQFRPESQC